MKRLLLAGALLVLPLSAPAAEEDPCAVLSYFADRVAEVRFNGGAMSDAMELSALIAQGDLAVKVLLQSIVIDAYALPNTGNPRQQQLERQEFSNQVALHCYLSRLE